MKREGIVPGTYHHVIVRGVRGMDFLHDNNDRWDCVRLLYYQNDSLRRKNWRRELKKLSLKNFERPDFWEKRNPLVKIMAFCIHDNHIHLIIKEIIENGLTSFMRRFPNSISNRYNEKYGGKGSIIEAAYKQRAIKSDSDLLNVTLYVLVKNVFERYEGGIFNAMQHIDDAIEWAKHDAFSSFPEYGSDRKSPIIEKDVLGHLFASPQKFHLEVKEYLANREIRESLIGDLLLEED